MSEPLSGTYGFVLVNGVPKSGDKWSGSFDQAVVDRSSFLTGGEPANARGQRTGEITFEGPLEGVLGMDRGNLYEFTLGVVAGALGVIVTGRVSNLTFTDDKDNGPRFSVKASQYGPIRVGAL